MTTHVLQGIYYRFDDSNVADTLNAATLELSLADGTNAISYFYDSPRGNRPTTTELHGQGTDVLGFTINGTEPLENRDSFILMMTWADSRGIVQTTMLLNIEYSDPGMGGFSFYLSGTPLPDFASPAEFQTFNTTQIRGLVDVPEGTTYAADTQIPLSALGFVSSTDNDTVYGSDEAETINLGAGDDLIYVRDGNDTVLGGAGADSIFGNSGDDVLFGDGPQAWFEEETAAFVYRLYLATLRREPDRQGQIDWVDLLESGAATMADAAAGFTGSREFQNVYGALTDTQFIELLYQNVLGRAADAGGLQGWLDAMTNGANRGQVVLGFANSTEFVNGTSVAAETFATGSDPASWTDEIYRVYLATLNREPDVAGLTGWTDALSNGSELTDAVAGFVASREFNATYGALNNTEFVELLYQNVLGRAADTGGLNGWKALLDGGTSRASVVLGFANSNEFITSTTPALEAWMRTQDNGDELVGGQGNDILAGGRFADVFVFSSEQPGDDTVLNLEAWDTLLFEGFGYTGEGDVRAHMTQQGDDVVFSDQSVTVTLVDMHLSSITDQMLDVGQLVP